MAPRRVLLLIFFFNSRRFPSFKKTHLLHVVGRTWHKEPQDHDTKLCLGRDAFHRSPHTRRLTARPAQCARGGCRWERTAIDTERGTKVGVVGSLKPWRVYTASPGHVPWEGPHAESYMVRAGSPWLTCLVRARAFLVLGAGLTLVG